MTAELNDTVDTANTAVGSTGSTGSTGRGNHKRVARTVAAAETSGIRLQRRVVTTVPDSITVPVPDLVARNSTMAAPRLLLATPGRVVHRRAHAHRAGR